MRENSVHEREKENKRERVGRERISEYRGVGKVGENFASREK